MHLFRSTLYSLIFALSAITASRANAVILPHAPIPEEKDRQSNDQPIVFAESVVFTSDRRQTQTKDNDLAEIETSVESISQPEFSGNFDLGWIQNESQKIQNSENISSTEELFDEAIAAQSPADPSESTPKTENRVLVVEVIVVGTENHPELEKLIYDTISTQPRQTITQEQLQEDVNAIFATGFFANAMANVTQVQEDVQLGLRITFQVEVNPVLSGVVLRNLPQGVGDPVMPQE
ncbi:MAG: hypothetical protein AB4290_10440, partial [Spirulina sp.]